jgi:hypothetical protein
MGDSAGSVSDFSLPDLSISSNECNLSGNLNDTSDMVRFYSRHNVTLSALKDTYKLAGKEKSTYFIKKDIERHVCYEYFFNVWCGHCKKYIQFNSKTTKMACFDCLNAVKLTETNYFVSIPVKQQLTNIINRYFDDIIKYHKEKVENNNNTDISDVHDGSIYQNILNNSPNVVQLSLVLNTDGVKIFNFGNDSLWPLQAYLNFLPPRLRYLNENILVFGLYYGSSKNLDVHSFFLPFCEEINDLHNGFPITKAPNITFLPIITHIAVDLPAKCKMLCIKQYNSEFGCGFCYQKGIPVNNKKTKGKTLRFLYASELCLLRTHTETLDIMLRVDPKVHKKGINGIKDISPLASLESCDLIHSFGIDYMHGTLRGAFLKEVGLWLETENCKEAYYISKRNKDIINKRITSIKGTTEMSKPRLIDHFSNFKAHEFRNFLLFFLPVILEGIVPKKYLDHLKLLSESTYILLKSRISANEVDLCEEKLDEYVRGFQELYKDVNVTMNVHMLRHVTKNVRNLGPLWAFSTFGFESNNGVLKRYVNGTSKVILQVAQKYVLNQSFASNISTLISPAKLIGAGKRIVIDEKHKQVVNDVFIGDRLHIYTSIEKKSKKLTSTSYKLTNSIDYFLLFDDNSVGKALYYFQHEGKIYVLFELYLSISNCSHLIKIQTSNSFKIKFVNAIKHKLLYISYKLGIHSIKEYVTFPPNYYEGS